MGMIIIVAVVAAGSLAGAAWGWRRGTANIENPPDKYEYPGGMTRREHLSLLRTKHQRRRVPLTITSGLAGGALAFLALLAFALVKR